MIGSAVDAGNPATVASADHAVVRLVPQSGVQIIDLALPTAELSQILLSYVEHRYVAGGASRTVLMPLDRVGSGDILWHPVSHRALVPDEIMSISGPAALDSFVGRWVPLPYLRFLGRDADGRNTFDSGPENWARIFVSPPVEVSGVGSVARLAIAFDTRLEMPDRSGERRYLAPNAEDALLGASFKLATGAGDMARFASRPWIDQWLRQNLAAYRLRPEGTGVRSAFELEHVARYLVLLELLSRYCRLPEIRFVDTLNRRWPVPVTGVDLVLDIAAADTAALLVHQQSGAHSAALVDAGTLRLRHLGRPAVLYDGPIPTQVEFAPPPFGDAGLSRRSGRPDAFAWPSLGRIGHEAVALALRSTATAGVTGETALPSLLQRTDIAEDTWRFGIDGADGASIGPVVSGPLLAHVAEDGTPLGRAGADRAPAIRPRFAPSSLMTFFHAELLLHALASINAADMTQETRRSTGVRELRRIVVTVPAGLPEAERASYLGHVAKAVELVWRALGWDRAGEIGAPQQPEVVLGAGTELATQMFQCRREIAARYGADPGLLLTGRAAADEAGRERALRVAGVEIEDGSVITLITDYGIAGEGGMIPLQAVADRWSAEDAGLVRTMAERFVLAAIASALAEAGVAAPELFLSRALDTTTARPSAERNLARRLRSKIIQPAAAALIAVVRELPPRIAGGQRSYSLPVLVARGGGRLEPVAHELEALAQRDGAAAFKLDGVQISFSQRQLDAAVRAATAPSILHAAEVVARHRCDLVVLSGALASLPAVLDDVIAHMPLPPGRIVLAARGDGAQAQPDADLRLAAIAAGRAAGVAGAYLATSAAPGFDAFNRVVNAIGQDASVPLPPPAAALPVGGGRAAGPAIIDVAPRIALAERLGGVET